MTSNDISGNISMHDAYSTDHGKLLNTEQLAHVMQMLQQVKNRGQNNDTPEIIAPESCVGISFYPSLFSLNFHSDSKAYSKTHG